MLTSASQLLPVQQAKAEGMSRQQGSKRRLSEGPTACSDLSELLLPQDSCHRTAHHVGRPLKRLAVVVRHVQCPAPQQQRTAQVPAPASQPHAPAVAAAAGVVPTQSLAVTHPAAHNPAPAPAAAAVDNTQAIASQEQLTASKVKSPGVSAAGSSLPPARTAAAAAGPNLQPDAAAAAVAQPAAVGAAADGQSPRPTAQKAPAKALAAVDSARVAAAAAAAAGSSLSPEAAAGPSPQRDAAAATAGGPTEAVCQGAAVGAAAGAAQLPGQLTAEATAAAEAALAAAAAAADARVRNSSEAAPAQPTVAADAAAVCELVQLFCPEVTAVAAISPDTAALAHNPAVTVDHPPSFELGSGFVSPRQLLTLSGLRAACAGLVPKAVSRKLLAAAEAAPPRPCRAEEGTGLAPWFWTAHQLLLQELAADVSLPAGSKQAAGERLTTAVRARVQLARLVTAAHQLLQQQVGAPHKQLPAPRASASRRGTAAATGDAAHPAGQAQWHLQLHQQQYSQPDIDSDEDEGADAPAAAAATGITAGLTLPPGPLAVAEAALHSVAAAVDGEAAAAAAAQWPPRLVGEDSSKELVADADLAQGLVQLLCPAASAVLALCKDTAPGALHNHAVAADDPPRYHAQDRAPLTPAQLLTRSGLKVACVGLLPNQLRSRLQQLAAAVATAPLPTVSPPGGVHGSEQQVQGDNAQGLLAWFWQAHSLMVSELGSPVWRASTDEVPHGQRLVKVVRARVQLVQLLATAFNLLCQGHPARSQGLGPAAAVGAARGAAAGLSAEARAAAEAALASAAALLDRRAAAAAAAGWPTPAAGPGHHMAFDSDVFVADIQLAAGFLQLLCPGFCNVAALRWETAGPLHNLPVELDEPPKWPAAGSSDSSDEGGAAQQQQQQQLHPAQLLAVSGLLAACGGLQPAAVRERLSELAVRTAPPPDGSCPGSGLLPFFWAAHELLLMELNSYVCTRQGDSTSPGQRFCEVVRARAQLAQLVMESYALSRRGRLTAKQQQSALLLQAAAPAEDGGSAEGQQPPCPMQPEGVAAVLGWLETLAADSSPDSLQAGADTQAAAAGGGSGGAAAASQHWQQGRYQPPSAEAVAAAEAACRTAAAAAAAVARQGQSAAAAAAAGSGVDEARGQASGSKVMLADAGAALQLLLLFYPGLLLAPALQPDAAQQLRNLPVVQDEPPKYVWGWAEWHEQLPRQQLCTVSGLKLACFCIEVRTLKQELNRLTDRAAAAAVDSVDGEQVGDDSSSGGLLLWFLWVRDVLLRELQAGVWGDTGEQVPLREQLQQQVLARVQLVHLVFSAFSALQEGEEEAEEGGVAA